MDGEGDYSRCQQMCRRWKADGIWLTEPTRLAITVGPGKLTKANQFSAQKLKQGSGVEGIRFS